jgi:hypothetical protein
MAKGLLHAMAKEWNRGAGFIIRQEAGAREVVERSGEIAWIRSIGKRD